METFNNIQFRTAYVLECLRSTVKFSDEWGVSTTWKSPYFIYAVSYDLRVLSDDHVWNKVNSEIESATISINVTHASDNDDLTITAYLGNRDLSGTYGYYISNNAREVGTITVTGDVDGTRQIITPSNFKKLPIGQSLYLTLVISGGGAVKCEGVAATASVTTDSIDIESITPKLIQTEINKSQEITIRASGLGPLSDVYIEGEYLYADGTVKLTANKKTIASCKLSDGSPRTVDYDDYSEREDIFKFTCTTDWFKTIESTQDTITVTVTIEDESVFKRKATGTFEIIKPPLSLTAEESEVTMTFGNDDEVNRITVTGSAGGVYSVTVKHGTVTEEPYTEYSTAEFYARVYKSWFQNQNFDSTNVTVTIQDELYRTAQVSFKASLPQMTVSTDKDSYESVSSGKQVSVSVDGAVGSTKISYRIGSSTTEDVGDSFGLLDDLFANTRSNQLSVTIIAQSLLYKQSAQTTITLTAGDGVYPKVSRIKVENVPHIKMPSDYANDYVAGYSKVKVSIKYTSGAAYIGDFTDFKLSGLGETVDLIYNGNPDDVWFTAITDSVIQRQTTLTATITDSMGRKGTDKVTIAENDIVKLSPITVTPQSTSVEAGNNAVFEVTGFVGSYDISFWNLSKQLTGGDTEQTSPTYTQKAKTDWFTEASVTGNNISVTVTVTDVLGRSPSQTVRITVTLPKLTLTLRHQDEIIKKLVINHILHVDFEGTGGEEVTLQLTTGSGENLINYGTWKGYEYVDINCAKVWFTQYYDLDNTATIQITVNATTNTQSAIATFDLVYPALGLTLQKSDGSGDTATEAEVGDNVIYAFANQEGEAVNVHYYYSNLTTPIRSLGPYSTSSATIATPQLFDDANANTVQTMKVSVVISDKRGRTAKVDNFAVKVNELMHPYVSSFSVTPLNPSTIVKEDLKNKFIENVSKFRVSIVFDPQTKAAMKPESVYVVLCRGYEWNEDTGRREYEGVYGRFQMKPVAGEINKYLFESDFTIPVFNKRFVVDKNGIMKGGSVLVIEAQDQRQMSAYLNRWMSWIGMQPDIYMYSLPRATDIHYHRCNQDETPNDAGEYCHVAIDYQFTGFWNGLLPPTAYNVGRVSATLDSETQYEDLPFSTSGGEPNPQSPDVPDTGTVEFTFDDVSMERTYDITITLSDLITSTTYTVRLSTAGVIMDFLRDGKGLALGKVAEHQGMVEVNPEWTFQSEKMKVRVKDGTDDKGMYDIGQLLCQILNRMNNGGL